MIMESDKCECCSVMSDEEARIEASKARAEEEDRKRRSKALLRFAFPEAARQKVKDAYAKVIDEQLDAVEANYGSIFSGFSTDELEGMSDKDASGFVSLVLEELGKSIAASGQKVNSEMSKIASDSDLIGSLSKAFRESSGLGPEAKTE